MFDEVTENLTSADLLVPWLIAGDAASLGYSVGAKWHDKGEDHRSQTRYFFLYVFFRFASQVLLEATHIDLDRRPDLYDALVKLRDDFARSGDPTAPFKRLLNVVDSVIATYMGLAREQRWYTDRNSFFKREEIVSEAHLLQASGAALLEKNDLRRAALVVMNGAAN